MAKASDNLYNARRRIRRQMVRISKLPDTEALIETLNNILNSSYLRNNSIRGIEAVSETRAYANLGEAARIIDRFETLNAVENNDFTQTDLERTLTRSEWLRANRGETSVYKQGAIKLFYSSYVDVFRGSNDTDKSIIKHINESDRNVYLWHMEDNKVVYDTDKNGNRIKNPNYREAQDITEAFEIWLDIQFKEQGTKFIEKLETSTDEQLYREFVTALRGWSRNG